MKKTTMRYEAFAEKMKLRDALVAQKGSVSPGRIGDVLVAIRNIDAQLVGIPRADKFRKRYESENGRVRK